jgi:hypothetical protein
MIIGPGGTALVTSSFVLDLRMSAMLGNRTVYVLVEVV